LGSLADLEGLLHHVDDALHSLNNVIGFGWAGNAKSETGTATGVTEIFTAVTGEVAAADTAKVAVKKPKQISTGLARMLAGKTTPDQATMMHNEFPITPTWRANYQGVRPGQICKRATELL
jgi:hypothetical protein